MLVDNVYAATLRFHDEPRADSAGFIGHLSPRHRVNRILLVSGDRESEVRYLAAAVGIQDVYASQTPEQKLEIVIRETAGATLFVGDGINDAPALIAATVGVAFGGASDITSEAADAVILDPSLGKVEELIHIGRTDAAHRAAECARRHGTQHDWHGARRVRLSSASGRCGGAGSDRSRCGAECGSCGVASTHVNELFKAPR